jgi:hypothetical protein
MSIMKSGKTAVKRDERGLLERLAARVQELYLEFQDARPADRATLRALYHEAYLAHRAHRIFIGEQDSRLAAVA